MKITVNIFPYKWENPVLNFTTWDGFANYLGTMRRDYTLRKTEHRSGYWFMIFRKDGAKEYICATVTGG